MSKRGENIYKRKDGRWEARYPKEYSFDGHIVYGYVYGKTYAEAKSKRTKKILDIGEIHTKQLIDNNDNRFRQVANKWIDSKQAVVKEATYVRYRYLLDKHIYPLLGDIRLSELEYTHVQNLIFSKEKKNNGKKGLATKTIQDIISVFRLVIRYAEEQHYLPQGQLKVKLPYGFMRQIEKR